MTQQQRLNLTCFVVWTLPKVSGFHWDPADIAWQGGGGGGGTLDSYHGSGRATHVGHGGAVCRGIVNLHPNMGYIKK